MKTLKLVVSLPNENSYQLEQARTAKEKASQLGADIRIIFAENDAVTQSQQVLEIVQSRAERPDAILFEPLTATALARVGEAAVDAGIGWVVLNREIDYDIAAIRRIRNVPVFRITSNHEEIGRIQGRQYTALLPKGGSVLYVEGPSNSSAARQRTAGMYETKAANIQIRTLKGEWTTESAQRAVQAWLRLSTSAKAQIDLIGCQNDAMALGVITALKDHGITPGKSVFVVGADAQPETMAAIKAGTQLDTVTHSPYLEAVWAVEAMSNYLQSKIKPPAGKFPQGNVIIPMTLVTRANVGKIAAWGTPGTIPPLPYGHARSLVVH